MKPYELTYELKHNDMDDSKPDIELVITYGERTIRLAIECKNWEPVTSKGVPVTVNYQNYYCSTHADVGGTSKFRGYDDYMKILLYRNALAILLSGAASAAKDNVSIAFWDTFRTWFRALVDALVGKDVRGRRETASGHLCDYTGSTGNGMALTNCLDNRINSQGSVGFPIRLGIT
jgi:hypothetical protein